MLFKISLIFSLFFCFNTKEVSIEINNEFALNLLSVLSNDLSNNQLFSPISLSSTLFQLLNGVKGQTLQEFQSLFNIQDLSKLENINKEMKLLLESIVKKDEKKDLTIKLLNKVLINNEIKLNENFDEIIKNYYNSSVNEVNFGLNAKNITKDINEWVFNKTNGKISKLFKDNLDSLSSLVLINVVYFNGKWKHPFNKNNTIKGDFLNSNNLISQIDFMTTQDKFKVKNWPKLESSLIELPFSENISFIILLPDDPKGLDLLSDNLTLKVLNEALDELDKENEQNIILTIPKFKIETDYDLKEPFEELELKTLFQDSADLSGINGQKNLKVSTAIHKATLELNEEGAEASAGTGIDLVYLSLPPTIKVDRPFIFIIRDKTNGLFLFLGRVNTLVNEELLSFGFI